MVDAARDGELMVRNASHKHQFLSDLERLGMPAVILKQFHIWRQGEQPLAYASWAQLTEEAEEKTTSGGAVRLQRHAMVQAVKRLGG